MVAVIQRGSAKQTLHQLLQRHKIFSKRHLAPLAMTPSGHVQVG
jgi:hypothetical protein